VFVDFKKLNYRLSNTAGLGARAVVACPKLSVSIFLDEHDMQFLSQVCTPHVFEVS